MANNAKVNLTHREEEEDEEDENEKEVCEMYNYHPERIFNIQHHKLYGLLHVDFPFKKNYHNYNRKFLGRLFSRTISAINENILSLLFKGPTEELT